MEKSWNCVFEFMWETVLRNFDSEIIILLRLIQKFLLEFYFRE